MSDSSASRGYEPIRERQIDDRKYELLSRGPCSCCGVEMLEVWRWSGAAFSRYKTPTNFTAEEFDFFVELIDEQLLQSSSELLEGFHTKLQDRNSNEGIYADYSYAFRLMEYGRQKTSALEKMKYLRVLTSNDTPSNKTEEAIRLSFELGYAAAEYRLIDVYEDYVHDGIAMSEWRHAGLPKAREERLRQGMRTRIEVLAAAKRLYAENPSLVRNDSETAREILKLNLPAMQKGRGQQLPVDAITRHLRAARKKYPHPEN
jgi:hypothetical protein